MAKPKTLAAKERMLPASEVPACIGKLLNWPLWANSPRTMRKMMVDGIHDQAS